MKKSILMLGLAVAAMTSCTNDEVVEMNQNNVIKFENFVNKGTRVVDNVTTSSLKKIYVFGYRENLVDPVFNNQLFSFTGSGDVTSSVFWVDDTYFFGAYADGGNGSEIATTGSGVPTVSFTSGGVLSFNDYVVDDAKDLVAAVPAEVDNTGLANLPVALTFNHLLSKIKFTFKNTNPNSLTMKVSEISLSAIPNKGDWTSSSATEWTNPEGSVELTFPGTTSNVAVNGSYVSIEHLVLPQTLNANVKANFTIEYYNAESELVDRDLYSVSLLGDGQNPVLSTWEPGKVYNYYSDMPSSPSVITFTIGVTPWADTKVDDTKGDSTVDF